MNHTLQILIEKLHQKQNSSQGHFHHAYEMQIKYLLIRHKTCSDALGITLPFLGILAHLPQHL